jgi:hypothetical protein
MSLEIVRKALEKRLATLTPSVAIAYENTTFTPVSGVPYIRVNLLPNTPDNSIMGQATYFERGIFQVMACYPLNAGTANAGDKAQAIRNHFKRGVTMVESGVTVIVMDTPKVAPAMIDVDRYSVPISISYQAQIIT